MIYGRVQNYHWISSCPKLVNISGVRNLVPFRSGLFGLVISPTGLRDGDYFDNLNLIARDLEIRDNFDLASIDGWASLHTVEGDICTTRNSSLTISAAQVLVD